MTDDIVRVNPSQARKPARDGEGAMFARKVAALLKPNSVAEFTDLMEYEILPWLRKQEGFVDLITLAAPDGREVTTISFWDQQADAEAYKTSGYPQVLEILERLLDAAPYVKTFEVVSSTFHGLAPVRRFEAEHLPEAGATQYDHPPAETSI